MITSHANIQNTRGQKKKQFSFLGLENSSGCKTMKLVQWSCTMEFHGAGITIRSAYGWKDEKMIQFAKVLYSVFNSNSIFIDSIQTAMSLHRVPNASVSWKQFQQWRARTSCPRYMVKYFSVLPTEVLSQTAQMFQSISPAGHGQIN